MQWTNLGPKFLFNTSMKYSFLNSNFSFKEQKKQKSGCSVSQPMLYADKMIHDFTKRTYVFY